jgi:hypothetical protein
MFSLQSRPRPLPQGLAADVLFDGRLAAAQARAIAERERDRQAGTVGDRSTGRLVRESFESRGFPVEVDRFEDDGKQLVNVIARRAGRSRRRIVVVAGRDATGVPDATGSAAATAALTEIARVYEGRPSRKTLVLASIDGSTLGEAGARRLPGELGDPDLIDGVLVISDLGANGDAYPIVSWSNDTRRAGIGLERTVAASLRQELDLSGSAAGTGGQLGRLAFPIGIGAQGVLLAAGYDSVRVSGSGELPADGSAGAARVDEDRIGSLGRGTLRALTALDQGPKPEHGPRSYVTAVSQVMPGWVVSFLALALLVPAVVAAVDAFARARRRRVPVAPWLRWILVTVLPFVGGLSLAYALALVGATPDPPGAPVPPGQNPLDFAAVAALCAVALVVGLSWWSARFLTQRSYPELDDPSSPGAACALCLVVALVSLALWVVNPYAALLLVPAAHLWMLATLPDPAPGRRARFVLVGSGVLPAVVLAAYFMATLDVGPFGGAWYLFLLIVGGHVGLFTALVGCVLLGALGCAVTIARRLPEVDEPPLEGPRLRATPTYAGPGSLGGTESELR